MKKILFLLAMLPMMIFTACSSSDDGLDSSPYLIPDGKYSITGSYLNTRDEDTNWLYIDNGLHIIDFYMEPNLGSAMIAWNSSFVEDGQTLKVAVGQESTEIKVVKRSKYFIQATVHYGNKKEFDITLRPK